MDMKLLRNLISTTICRVWNLSLKKCIFPQAWKTAKIIPLPKNPTVSFCGSNSRPISLLPALSKIMEKIVFKQIQNYFAADDFYTDYQHAYREEHSTFTALTQMADEWLREIDNRHPVGAVLLDFSAAFDIIDHNLLLQKLACYGFSSTATRWLESYLKNRKQTVLFNGSLSELIDCGVPQRISLGPLLYSIFTNDLPLTLKDAKISMYADDPTIYIAKPTIDELSSVLNQELPAVVTWITHNKLVLNTAKTNSIVFGTKTMLTNKLKLRLYVNDVAVEQVQETKILAIISDNKLTWSKHIEKVTNKMGKSLSTIRRCRDFLPFNVRGSVIKSLVLSHLDYCSEIWSCSATSSIKKLQTA